MFPETEPAAEPWARGPWAELGLSGAELWLQQGQRGLAPAQPTAWRDSDISQTEHSDHGNFLSGVKEQVPLEACASPERPYKGQSGILALTVGWRR